MHFLQDVVAIVEAAAAASFKDEALISAACKELIGDADELKPEQLMAASMALAKLTYFSTDWKNSVSEQVRLVSNAYAKPSGDLIHDT